LIQRDGAEPFAIHAGRVVTVSAFLDDVVVAAEALPDGAWLINACEDRYRFLVGFFAVAVAGRTNLLAPARTAEVLQRLQGEYPHARLLTDELVLLHDAARQAPRQRVVAAPTVPDDAVAAIAFTSGSTGTPQPHPKCWGALRSGACMHAERLGVKAPATLVATVPPWHMYGLEWTVLVATVAPVTVYCGEAFYPGDLRRALGSREGPRVLVTTPIHLRAMLRSAVDYPRTDTVVCATAPLAPALAAEAESRLGARLLEIYGCSEAGTLAHRRPTRDERWQLFPGFGLTVRDAVASVCGGLLPQPVVLADRLELGDDGTFRLLGRQGDLVKVAGKRASLADLTARLLSIPGVEDGVIVEPSALGAGDGDRLCAFVVAPGLSAQAIRRHLAELIDPAFLPRPLKVVAQLPRSQTGKLTRESLQVLLDSDVGTR
jgi:acyl-coenzyme A synthetase/AMP-(fatty) acid ligase